MPEESIMKRYIIIASAIILFLFQSLSADDLVLPAGLLKLTARPAPTTHLKDIDGGAYKLEKNKGSLVFVHFWASWCVPCRKEMPAIQRMWNILGKEGLKIALINTAEDEDTVFSFLSIHAPNIRALMDSDGLITEKWRPRGLPATYLVDQNGNIQYQALGGRPWDDKTYLEFLRKQMKQSQ